MKRLLLPYLISSLGFVPSVSRADDYDNVRLECYYITQCSVSKANATIGA